MSLLEISILLLTLFLLITIVWTTFRVGISPMPSSAKAYHAISRLLDDTGKGAIYDLGSGWGTLVIRIAKSHPERQVIGYELSLFPYLMSRLVKRLMGLKNLKLYRQDFLRADLNEASVLVCYLYPDAMCKLAQLIEHQTHNLKPDFVISNNFALPYCKPDRLIRINDLYRSPVYRYDLSLPPKKNN
ncbi:class I SAM-dependent methyltransferase [uncultured Shewanella sp.]|uniref:class I SAM-dependent methyltransferase n=1 Tax=Shewanella atlantica TaxID=271099 RepID=UPI0026246A81|nr:class I SAM-dependent methyltransferase [uncultured Shewanella sp.]